MSPFIAVVDYGVGNLHSVKNALSFLGLASKITGDAVELAQASAIILPGVGAFPDAADRLWNSGLAGVIQAQAIYTPTLGICLGMQLLFDRSEEGRSVPGLGLIPGVCKKIPTEENLPQIGWNELSCKKSPLFEHINGGEYVYFVHSYHCVPKDDSNIIATTDYGCDVTAAVQRGNVFGCQFHPEKSGEAGLTILSNFGALL